MRVKEILKNNRIVLKIYSEMLHIYNSGLTVISPTLNTKARYRQMFKRRLPLDNPQTLNEKILWLKLNRYMKDPLVIQCADKYAVRSYVEECGCGDILNELYAVYDSVDEIVWDELPQQFALKWNFGAGKNIICADKSQMDKNAVLEQMRKWGKDRCWLPYSEMQYKYIPKKIICERFISTDEEG